MADILDSRVIKIDGAETSDDAVQIDYDPDMNTYGQDGEAVTTFYSGEPIYLLVQLEPGFRIANIRKTSGGVTNLGLVDRIETVTDRFFQDDAEQELKWYPTTAITVAGDHLQEGDQVLTADGKKITCSNPPSVLDYSYGFQAYSIRVNHPGNMNIAEDEAFPLGLVIEVTK